MTDMSDEGLSRATTAQQPPSPAHAGHSPTIDNPLYMDYTQSELDSMFFPSLKRQKPTWFPLMKLPPELRLNVFDQLFTDLTIERQRAVEDLNVYHEEAEWPSNDLSSYLNLMLTCKEIRDAAKSLWENAYVHRCCFYFWKVPDFYRVAQSLLRVGGPYTSVQYALRSRTFEEIKYDEAEFVDNATEELIRHQPGFPSGNDDYANGHWAWPDFFDGISGGAHTLRPDGRIPFEIYHQESAHRIYARAAFPGFTDCSVSVHERRPREQHGTQYLLMSGKISGVSWDMYDACVTHGQLMIWEEWERRGFPSGCLEKWSIAFAWRSRAQRGYDKVWLSLGGDEWDDLEDLKAMEEEYDLSNWLMVRHFD